MYTLQATAASSLSLPPESYIYSIARSVPGSFAAISSDDSLRVFDAAHLDHVTVVAAKTHDAGVTSLRSYAAGESQLLATGGREGKVKLWDVRAKQAVVEMETARHAPVLSVACNAENNTIVSGTELLSSQAVVAFWDIRSPQAPRLQYVESHNDDITELQYHPTRSNILLSGSTDGLVNIYDTTVTDEDEALVQVINHGSVHHAGFISERTIYALSHDEQFSIHPATDPDDSAQEPDPVHFDDVREPLGCEFLTVRMLTLPLRLGPSRNKQLDLIPVVPTPNWRFDMDNLWRLPGAHGEEVVRSVFLDEQSQAVFTGGEDGFVRAWRPVEEGNQSAQNPAAPAKVPRPKEKKQKDRFKPY
ncbi:hypothetical protein POX_c04023 [Penicillium oxalicum]|uniref:hypothetical protein n=1 Tax=Penicillium oxalicum TaxID=69781 RepID=UPI0020B7D9D7|nr:hypothetical protein POX_c04023 [Penicillium oxalicum]KAI2791167.1 hypothetical protein POX_c04023 [Penicillium oxalicum]